ncbi:MAG: LptF/LptG family permease [Verrucomicrobiae bacterium]|nr:LptF/LptG family permease [Verrucomicrobiae bacterium]
MTTILDRYFLREFLKPLGACLLAFLLCMLIYDLYDNLDDFIGAHVGLGEIIRYYAILIPAWLTDIMPITLLLSLLYVLSNMSKHGELTAMRASGLDFLRLMTPFFAVGLLMSGVMMWVSLYWAPTALQNSKVLLDRSTKKNSQIDKTKFKSVVYRDLATERVWWFDNLDLEDEKAWGIEITEGAGRGGYARRISAKTAYYRDKRWTFFDVMIYDYTLPTADPNSLRMQQSLQGDEYDAPPQYFVAAIKKPKRMTTGELLASLRFADRLSARQKAAFQMELHGRLAFPLSNIVVFLIGVPFGVVGQRKSSFMAVANAMVFFFVYLAFGKAMVIMGGAGRLPPHLTAWLANLIFAAAGIWMIRKIR